MDINDHVIKNILDYILRYYCIELNKIKKLIQ